MRHLDRDAHRLEVAEIHRARDQHLVADHRHLAAELALALRRESRGQRGVEQRDVAVGNRGRHLGRDHFVVVGQVGAARRLVPGANRQELLGLEVREDALRLEEVGKAAIVQARAPELVGLFLELGLDAPIDFLHQAAEVVVVALERLFDEIRNVLRDCVVADELDQIIFVVLREAIRGRVGRRRRRRRCDAP